MIFILSGKMIFEAKDIDNAFMEISKHFKDMAEGRDGIGLFPETDIELKPLVEPEGDYRTCRKRGQK